MAAEHVISSLHSCSVGFFFVFCFFWAPVVFVHHFFLASHCFKRERESKAAPGDMCKVVDLLLMIVYSKERN